MLNMLRLSTKFVRCYHRTNSIGIGLYRKLGPRTSSNFHSNCVNALQSSCDGLPTSHLIIPHRTLSVSSICLQKESLQDTADAENKIPNPDDQSGKKTEHLSVFKRFKQAYKEHGKVLIGVHCVTSTVWMSVFYYAAASGLDLTPLLEKIGAAEKIIEIAHSSVGNLATAYLMYKLATPARYTVTLFGTYSTVKYLQKHGYMEAPETRDSLRTLMKDSRSQMKDRYEDLKDDMKEKIEDMRDDLKDKYTEKGKKKS